MFNTTLERELMDGDEVIVALKKGTNTVSESTSKQLINELRLLQTAHKWRQKLSPKKMAIFGLIAFLVGIGLFRIGMTLEGALPLNSYTADSNSYEYRRGQEINSQIGGYMAFGIMLIMLPIAEVVLFYFLKSRSRRYIQQIAELKVILSKTS